MKLKDLLIKVFGREWNRGMSEVTGACRMTVRRWAKADELPEYAADALYAHLVKEIEEKEKILRKL